MTSQHDDVMAAISFYRAVLDGDEASQRQLVAETAIGDIPRGLLTLVGSLLAAHAAAHGITQDALLDILLAQYRTADLLDHLDSRPQL